MHEVNAVYDRLSDILKSLFDKDIRKEDAMTLNILGGTTVNGKIPIMLEDASGKRLYGLVEVVDNAKRFLKEVGEGSISSSFIGGVKTDTLPTRGLGFSWDADGREDAEYFGDVMKEAEEKGLFDDAILFSVIMRRRNASFTLHG